MQIPKLMEHIASGKLDGALAGLYPDTDAARQRYLNNLAAYRAAFGDGDVRLFSAPGRTEIGGNHTDHQNGCVLAAAVHLDVIGCAGAQEGCIEIRSEGYPPNCVTLRDLSPVQAERESTDALIRGVCAYFAKKGYAVGGFRAHTVSNVAGGAGLSSSAAFSVLVGTILSRLYNGGGVPAAEIAQAGRYAENEYFGKPSGLMDQMAAAVGGFVGIDFGGAQPRVEPVRFDFGATGHRLCIVDTRGSHAGLTGEYAAVRDEMTQVARALGKRTLAETDLRAFFRELSRLRAACGDRAVLRSMHFLQETRRAVEEKEALQQGRFDAFLGLVNESGASSTALLQNIYPTGAHEKQPAAVALAVSNLALQGRGACRIHGGGFGGTVQAFVPDELFGGFRAALDHVFGAGACQEVRIRSTGGTELAADA